MIAAWSIANLNLFCWFWILKSGTDSFVWHEVKYVIKLTWENYLKVINANDVF